MNVHVMPIVVDPDALDAQRRRRVALASAVHEYMSKRIRARVVEAHGDAFAAIAPLVPGDDSRLH